MHPISKMTAARLIMELPATITGEIGINTAGMDELLKANTDALQARIEAENKKYFLDECTKFDAFSKDLKEGLQRELKDLNKEITEKKRILKNSTESVGTKA